MLLPAVFFYPLVTRDMITAKYFFATKCKLNIFHEALQYFLDKLTANNNEVEFTFHIKRTTNV